LGKLVLANIMHPVLQDRDQEQLPRGVELDGLRAADGLEAAPYVLASLEVPDTLEGVPGARPMK
jgi:hypothetical protein